MSKYKIINRKKRFATILADLAGAALCAPFKRLCPQRPIDPALIRSVLVIRTAYIGDVVMALPMLRPLKTLYPQAELTFLTCSGARPVLENNPYVDKVITYDPFWFFPGRLSEYLSFIRKLRKTRFDLVIEARGDIREILCLAAPLKSRYTVSHTFGGGAYLLTHPVPAPGKGHKAEYHKIESHLDILRFLGWKGSSGVEWGICLTARECRAVEQKMAAWGLKGPFIAVHPGSRLALKCLPVDTCAALYDQLMARYQMPLVMLGGPADGEKVRQIQGRMHGQAINLAGQTDLRQMAHILSCAAVFICNDSAPMHIASTTRVPVIAVFGPSKSEKTGPFSVAGQVVELPMPCRRQCDESHCRHHRFNACMTDIGVDQILNRVARVLGPGTAPGPKDEHV